MTLSVAPPVSPMLAKLTRELPLGDFLYEPKYDGFRCIVFRDGDEVELGSRNERPLTRYFPELADPLRAALPPGAVVDGEIVIAGPNGLDFDRLSQRIHPAASRVNKLAGETPATFVAFDLLAEGDDDLRALPFRDRRARLEALLGGSRSPVLLTPVTTDPDVARAWFDDFEGAGLDGVIAKPTDAPYAEGERVMAKVKHQRTADCVVGGYRLHKDGEGIGSLLLGLFDDGAVLHHVGVASSFAAPMRRELADELAPLREGAADAHPWAIALGPPAGTEAVDAPSGAASDGEHRRPGAPSRWNAKKDLSWEPLRPERVLEVAYDHLQGNRFRHTTRFVRWRPDRDPASCTYDQLDAVVPAEFLALFS